MKWNAKTYKQQQLTALLSVSEREPFLAAEWIVHGMKQSVTTLSNSNVNFITWANSLKATVTTCKFCQDTDYQTFISAISQAPVLIINHQYVWLDSNHVWW